MNSPRNLCWKLNWYRHSELEGALLLGKLARRSSEPELVRRLTRHCADEARHAWLWDRTLAALDLPVLHIGRSYQSFYHVEVGTPRTVAEVLALTHVFEQRVDQQFTADVADPDVPLAARRTFRLMLRDEQAHLEWVAGWLAAHPGTGILLERYRLADERVYRMLLPYKDRVWDIPGIDGATSARRAHEEEFHAAQHQHCA
jgi:hypothetical protein